MAETPSKAADAISEEDADDDVFEAASSSCQPRVSCGEGNQSQKKLINSQLTDCERSSTSEKHLDSRCETRAKTPDTNLAQDKAEAEPNLCQQSPGNVFAEDEFVKMCSSLQRAMVRSTHSLTTKNTNQQLL